MRRPELNWPFGRLIVPLNGAALKWKALISFLGLVFLLSCATSSTAKQVKIYQDNMVPLVGKDAEEVTKTIAFSWKFGLLDRWEAVDPSLETVIKNNFQKHGFSKQEARGIFAPKGAYKVMLFLKLLGREEANTEVQLNMSFVGKFEKNIALEVAYIRVVFRDNKLINQRVW